MTQITYIVDADDFYDTNNGFEYLNRIKEAIPQFKITLFTIIGKCTLEFIHKVKTIEWIDMVPHGWTHDTPRECENWTYEQAILYLDRIESLHLTKGFRAPGWQISDGIYQALIERGYWVADQTYNNNRRPKELKCYFLDSPYKHHFHIQNVCGNGLEESMDKLLSLTNGDFAFVKDVI